MRAPFTLLLTIGFIVLAMAAWEQKAIWLQTRYDALIVPAATRANVDPLLIRAIIWRESRFQPHARGLNKERGLMQITPGVANEWATVTHSPPVDPEALFDPKTNIEIGTWYFARMLRHWQGLVDNPPAFALAEYNAGRSNALRWIDPDQPTSAAAFKDRITFGSTHRYVDAILNQYAAYQRGYFRPPWMGLWDRFRHKADLPTLAN